MSQRLISKTVPQPRRIIGFAAGQPIYELRGSAPEGEQGASGSGSSESGQSQQSGSGSGENGSSSEGGNEGGTGEGGTGQTGEGTSEQRSELDQIKDRMKAADRRAAEAERKLQEAERAKLTEDERKEAELSELRTYRTQTEDEIGSLRLQVAFLSTNDVTWHDPSIAMSQIDLKSITDEDGSVDQTALKRAIKKLSEDKPYLVKTGTGEASGGGAGEGGGQNGASGGGVGSKSKSKSGQGLSEDELMRRYPALYT